MALLEGRWDCSNCLTKSIKGRFKKCPTCNDPRNPTLTPEEKPYLPSGAEEVTDPGLRRMFEAGPDWNCGHCGEANRGDASRCTNCDRSRDGDDMTGSTREYLSGKFADAVTFDNSDQEVTDRATDLVPDPVLQADRVMSGAADRPQQSRRYTYPESSLRRDGEISQRVSAYQRERQISQSGLLSRLWEQQRSSVLIIWAAFFLAVTVLCGLLIYNAYFKTEAVTLRVDALTWSRSVEVEEYRTLVESDWEVPRGGRFIRSFEDIRDYDNVFSHYEQVPRQVPKQVPDGTESYECGSRTIDNGNGSFSTETKYCSRTKYRTEYNTEYDRVARYKDVPVYETRYEYEIDRWVHHNWVLAAGGGGELAVEPYWPVPTGLSAKQRVGSGKLEEYRVSLLGEPGQVFDDEPGFDTWRQLRKGDKVTGQITRNGKLRTVEYDAAVRAA